MARQDKPPGMGRNPKEIHQVKSRRFLYIFIIAAAAVFRANAQEDIFYRLELGAGLGAGFGLNDVNSKFYGNTNLAGALIARFPLNPRMAIKAIAGYNRVSGTTVGIDDFYPADPDKSGTERLAYDVKGHIIDVCALYELHFLAYGWEKGFQSHSRVTPYIQFGMGLTYGTAGKAFTVNFPIGVGLKWKVRERLNLGLDWTFHFTPSDKLDGLQAPLGIKSSEFRNKDHYCLTLLTLTYDLSPQCPTCNKN